MASRELFGPWVGSSKLPVGQEGLYAILAVPKTGMAVTPYATNFTAVVYFDDTSVYSCPGAWWSDGTDGTGFKVATLYVENTGTISLGVCWSAGNVAPKDVTANYDFYYKRIGEVYFS